MAPEQWLGEPAEYGNDIWAVGCVLYELLSGRLPRSYATPTDYVAAAARREQVQALPSSADTPAWLGGAVMAMLEPDPRNRPTAAECVQLLSGPRVRIFPAIIPAPLLAPTHSPTQLAAPPKASASPPPRAWLPRAAQGAAALTAVTAAGIVIALALAYGPARGTGQSQNPGTRGPAAASVDSPSSVSAISATTPATHSPPSQAATPKAADAPAPASGVWIAQLASVPVSTGFAELQSEMDQVRAEIPGAHYLDSSDYASLNPGYWVVYYPGSFTDGTQAVDFCAAHGRTTRNQCVGRFLSHDIRDKTHICFPPGGSLEAACYRPT